MKSSRMNRRECLEGLLVAATSTAIGRAQAMQPATQYVLKNSNLEFGFALEQGKVTTRYLRNKLANERVDLPGPDFVLDFGDAADSSQFNAHLVHHTGENVQLLYTAGTRAVANVEVRVDYSLPPSRHYLRKQISLRQVRSDAVRKLVRADLEVWRGVQRDWKSARGGSKPYGSHPIVCDTLWAGVEFVAAFNDYSREGFVLRSRPGGRALGSEWMRLHPTVVGVARPGEARASFLRYIDDIRLAPPRFVAGYNTWWSLPELFNEQECTPLIQALVDNLQKKHRVFFDVVTLDMGWSAPRTIWGVDRTSFPQGLTNLVSTVEAAGGKLGLWMSPSEVYTPVIDYAWAESSGYEVVKPGHGIASGHPGLSLADPKYREAAKRQLPQLIRVNRLGHLKYDGFICREERAHHDLLPGDDSVEPLAEHALELIKASKAADPNVFTEPTFLNSLANYISPWIIQHADSVWGNAGGDCPPGLGPAPDAREARTTAREYYIFKSLEEVWLPQNALQYFDIIHCDDSGSFPNHAAMAVGRGRFFLSTYLNPKCMQEEDWRIFAGLLKWARRNQDVLKKTIILTSRVELGEPYAYAHWQGLHGIVAARNPSNESKRFTLDMARAAAPPGLAQAVCYAQYPYRKGVAEGLTRTSRIPIELAPWELVFLEIVPRADLREPVALGARWTRDEAGRMQVASEGSNSIRIVLPGGGEQMVGTTPLATGEVRGEVIAQSRARLPEDKWLRQGEKAVPTSSFELENRLSIPPGASSGKALLLLQFPGKVHLPSTCTCGVNGQATELKQSSSESKIGDYDIVSADSPYAELQPYISRWTWYMADLASGLSQVRFSGTLPDENCHLGLWVWADWDLSRESTSVELQCPEPDMPPYQEHVKRVGVRIVPTGT
jgi:hypothetical protein